MAFMSCEKIVSKNQHLEIGRTDFLARIVEELRFAHYNLLFKELSIVLKRTIPTCLN